MKKFCLCFLILFLSGCSSPLRYVFIDSNVSAEIFITDEFGSEKVGETPFYGDLRGADMKNVSLRKKGYKTAPLVKSNNKNEPYFVHLKGEN